MRAPSLPLTATPEEREIIQAGEDFAALLRHPGWRRVTAFMQQWTLEGLAAMEAADLSDDRKALDLLRTWKAREEVFQRVQDHVKEGIAHAEAWLAEMRQSQNPLDIELLKEYMDVYAASAGDPGSGPE